jgi:hypothetical protein
MIIAYLIRDIRSLLTCSLISRSWHIATVPHLHRTLTARIPSIHEPRKTKWPEPLRRASRLGLLPFVTRVLISGETSMGFYPKQFHYWTRREFSALTNVQELSIDNLDIPSFIPRVHRYFGQFSQTLRSLTLKAPKGSNRQIMFFIGLFPHLEDLGLHSGRLSSLDRPEGDLTLIPLFTPSLGGCLTGRYSGGDGLVKTMIELFGGVRFRHMDLLDTDGAQLLLYTCADTLETLQLYATDLHGEMFSSKGIRCLVDDCTDRSSLQGYDLSRNRSLRQLKITAQSFIVALGESATTSSSLRVVLSTIKSPTFSDVFIDYETYNFCNNMYHSDQRAEPGEEDEWYRRQFDAFREMLKAGDFRLVLRAWNVSDDSMREFERAEAAENARGELLIMPMPHALWAY